MTGLVDKGLIVRESATDDRRRVSLLLTPRGKSVLATAQSETQEAVAGQMAGLTDDQRATIARAMQLLQDVFANVRDLVRDEDPVGPEQGDED